MSAPPLVVSVSGSPPTVERQQPDETADDNAQAEEHDVRLTGWTLDVAQRLSGALHVPRRAGEPEQVAPVDDGLGTEGNFLAAADQFLEGDAAPVLLGQDREWLLRRLSLRHHHVEGRHRKVEKRGVLDFLSKRQASTEQHSPPGRDGDDIARSQNGLRRGINHLGASPDAFHEDALGARGALEIRHCPARQSVGQPVRTDAPFPVGQVNVLVRAVGFPTTSALASFWLSAFRSMPKQTGSRGRQKPDDESGAHQVADRIGHRDVVLQPRLLGLGQIEPVDRVAGGADDGRFGERPGHEAGGRPAVVAKQPRRHDRRHQTRHAEHDRQHDLGQRTLLQAAKELRPDLVAGGKQEEREEHRLDRGIDLDVELSDEHARDERARRRSRA